MIYALPASLSHTMSLELVIGPMFAGKSTVAVTRVRRARILGWKTFVITSALDTRYESAAFSIKTHDRDGVPAVGISKLHDVLTFGDFLSANMIVIEEAQFFPDLYEFVKKAVEVYQKTVVVVGLDGDSERKPFGQILELIPIADTVTKLSALCKRCGDGSPAVFTALVKAGSKQEQVYVGGSETYEAMCRKHYTINTSV